VKKIRSRGRAWRFSGDAKVNGQTVAEAEVSAMIVDTDETTHLHAR
jgi:3-hydroxyacyl-[acyl-carrier-protein] dehydratase